MSEGIQIQQDMGENHGPAGHRVEDMIEESNHTTREDLKNNHLDQGLPESVKFYNPFEEDFLNMQQVGFSANGNSTTFNFEPYGAQHQEQGQELFKTNPFAEDANCPEESQPITAEHSEHEQQRRTT